MAYSPSLSARSRFSYINDPDEALDMAYDYDHGGYIDALDNFDDDEGMTWLDE
jgi:hypothetical protein